MVLTDTTKYKQAEQVLQRRNRELALLNRAWQVFGSTLDLDQVRATVLEEVRNLMDVTACSIWLTDPETGEPVCRQATGPRNETVQNWRLQPGEGLAGWVVHSGESLIVPDARTDERHFKGIDPEDELGLRSILSVPLQVNENVIGVLQVMDTEVGRFGAEDLTLLEPLAASAAIAIENARLCQQAQQEIAERRRMEAALWESEGELSAIFDSSPVGMVVLDQERRVCRANRAAIGASGHPAEEIIGLRGGEALRCLHALDDPRGCGFGPACETCVLRSTVVDTFETSHSHYQVEGKFVSIHGKEYEERDLLVSTTPLSVLGSQMVLVSIEDITERKRTERALRDSEARFRVLSEAAFEGIGFSEEGIIVDMNQQFAELLGYKVEEVRGMHVNEMVMPEDRELVRSSIRSGNEQPYEHRALRKDGTVIFVEVRPRMMSIEGQFKRVTAVRDITERKRAEEERARLLAQVREQAQRVQHIVDTVPEGVLLLDADLRILSANPPGREYLAILVGAGIGDTLSHLGDCPTSEFLTSPPKGLWHEVEAKGPPRRLFEVVARPLESGPKTEGWVLVLRDVTRERETQQYMQQQDRLAAVGQLAAGIAHDFNNIMATIVLYAQMLARMPDLPRRNREQLVTINQQAMHASHLIHQILDFSRSAALERQSVDLLPLLKEQVKLLERTLPENIKIDLAYTQDRYTINADPTRMQQVLMNLAINARDAMPEGGTLRIGLEQMQVKNRKEAPLPEMDAGTWMRVTVSDTGTGISPEVLPHIFDPFFTTKPAGEGTGLGLAQVWGIVNQHEGTIDVKTQAGEGTTFTIYLPALNGSQPEILAQERVSALPQGESETILVVEDNPTVRQAVTEGLESLNYRTLAAADGQEAVDRFEQYAGEIALVVSDTVMPGMGGVALLHALRERGYTGQIVMLTGHPLHDNGEELHSQGVAARLQKPVSLERLAQVLARALHP